MQTGHERAAKGLTLQQRLFLITAGIGVLVLGLIAWVGIRERNAQEEFLRVRMQGEADRKMAELDLLLETGQDLLLQMMIDDPDLKTLAAADEWDTELYLTHQGVSRRLNRFRQILPFDVVPFVYYEKADIFFNGGVRPDMEKILRERIGNRKQVPFLKLWDWIVPEGQPVLCYMVDLGHYVAGIWVEMSELERYLQEDEQEMREAFLKEDGTLLAGFPYTALGEIKEVHGQDGTYYIDAEGEQSTGFISESVQGNFRLLGLVRLREIQKHTRNPARGVMMAFMFYLILFVTYLFLWHRWFLQPMNLLRESMAHIQEGDTAFRIAESTHGSEEFRIVVREFNNLMDHMNQLRIQIYEDELKQERTKLDYLSRQIQPHFILNTLNTLYNHSQDPETFRELLMLTSRYYRYVVYVNSSQVPLGEEMDHIENYLKLQKIRYPRGFEFQVSCPDKLRRFPIPPFLIESFVGNAVKYGISPGEESFLSVTAGEKEDGTCWIAVQDKGEGFSEEILRAAEEFRKTGKGTEELGEGMRNSMERLMLIYQDRASITFSNQEGGARVLVEIRKDD